MAEKTIGKKRYLSTIFSQFKKKCVDVNSRLFVPNACVYTSYFDNSNVTCCMPVLKSGRFSGAYRIAFGGDNIRQCIGLPDSDVPVSVAKDKFSDCVKSFKAFYYHEIGHVRYTAVMSPKFQLYPHTDEVQALHDLFNILEDIVIERYCMSIDYPYTKKYFEFLENNCFSTEVLQKYTDRGTVGSLFDFILFKLRRGSAFVGTNAIFSAHETDMLSHIKAVLSTRDSDERIDKTIEFFEYLKSLGLDMTNTGEHVSSSSNCVHGAQAGKNQSSSAEKHASSASSSGVNQSVSNNFGNAGTNSAGCGAPDGDAEDGGGSGGRNKVEYDPTEDCPIDENSCYESFNQKLFSDDVCHSFYDMSYFTIVDRASLMNSLDAMMSMVNPQANQIATVIKTYQSRNRLRYHAGKSSGKLHVPSAISGKPVNIFKKKEQLGLMPDLAISVLVDNSGSMGGLKSEIATRSMLSLAVACSKCNIPLEINAFSLGISSCGGACDYDCQTYRIKQFNDSFDKSKPYFGIVSSELNDFYQTECACFSSNYDEVNLYNIWRDYRKMPWRDKVLIVISDGYTCGSSEDLRGVIKAAEADGIYVLGIGMCTDCVCNLYSNSKAFMSMTDIEQLPSFLGNTLTSLIKR